MIRVLVAVDSPEVRSGLVATIAAEPDLRIVDEEYDADVAVIAEARSRPHGEVSEHDEGDLDSRTTRPATIVLLAPMDAEAAREAYGSGASAVLATDVDGDELVSAIRAVDAGLVVMPSILSAELLALSRPVVAYTSVSAPAGIPLTPREREVLTLLAQGLANKMIAPRLGISEHTVKTHVAAVYEKLHARNRAEAVVAAARQGLLLL
ncbi:MAG: LuxR C-terminal-related transcriptional regulator [Gemmatimonadaceae bacterium]